MSNFVQISNTKLEEVKGKLDALPALISGFDTHESKTSAQHLSELKNASVRDINNTGSIGDGSSNHTSVALGYDRTGGKGRALLVDTDGRLKTSVMGNTEADGSGTHTHLHTDATGNLLTQVVSTVNVAPANTVNSGITDDPANTYAVGLRARQTITDSSSETFLKCDASGVLQVSSSGGGGSSTYTLEQQSASHNTLQLIGNGNGQQYIDTNGGSKFVVVVQTNDGSGSPNISVEWSDNTSFSTNQVFVCNGFIAGNADATPKTVAGVIRVDSSTLTSQAIFAYDTIPARYARVTVLQQSGGAITYTAKTALSP